MDHAREKYRVGQHTMRACPRIATPLVRPTPFKARIALSACIRGSTSGPRAQMLANRQGFFRAVDKRLNGAPRATHYTGRVLQMLLACPDQAGG